MSRKYTKRKYDKEHRLCVLINFDDGHATIDLYEHDDRHWIEPASFWDAKTINQSLYEELLKLKNKHFEVDIKMSLQEFLSKYYLNHSNKEMPLIKEGA